MGLGTEARLVTHIGGGYGDKGKSLELFLRNWQRVPNQVARRIVLENDDRTFTAGDALYLSGKLGMPVVLDVHHFICNREKGSSLEEILPGFLASWNGSGLCPKVHVSSPRSVSDIRSHHDFVNAEDVYAFIKKAARYSRDIDVMVEAKKKDSAMFRLVGELSALPGVRRVNRTSLEVTG